MRPRTLFLRLTWAVGLLVLCLLAFFGIGWSVSRRQPWLEYRVGRERFWRWYQSYATTAATLLPGDRDGDGVCDGLELFLGTDPNNASSCPIVYLSSDDGAFLISMGYENDLPTPAGTKPVRGYLLQPGERREIYDRIMVYQEGGLLIFAQGFRLRLTPPPGISLATVGGPFVTGPIVVPVASDGSIDFEIRASAESANAKPLTGDISMANAATGAHLFLMPVRLIWAEDALVATVDEVGHSRVGNLRLHWATILPGPQLALIEAARDTPDAKWYQIGTCPPDRTSCFLFHWRVTNFVDDYTGPLKFRIVPFRYSPPNPAQ